MSFILGVLSGAILAVLAAFLGLHKFYKEKWWDKQFTITSELLECIYTVKSHIQSLKDESEEKIQSGQIRNEALDPKAEMNQKFKDAELGIMKAMGNAELLLGKAAFELIKNYNFDIMRLRDKWEYEVFNPQLYYDHLSDKLKLIEDLSDKLTLLSRSILNRDSIISSLNEKFWALKYPMQFRAWACYKGKQE